MMRKLAYEEIFATRPSLESLNKLTRFPMYCLVENVRSLYNVGSIFRTSDAVRLKKLFLTGYTGHPPKKEIDKTALGAVDSVPWHYHNNPQCAVEELKTNNIPLIALEHTTNSISYTEFSIIFPFCLLLGNEVDGLSKHLIDQADYALEIPMYGLKQSLNVSVAYGVVMYHALAQLIKNEKEY
jgi:tRNA G18 (ribose-2'-O)-methylase SpoU